MIELDQSPVQGVFDRLSLTVLALAVLLLAGGCDRRNGGTRWAGRVSGDWKLTELRGGWLDDTIRVDPASKGPILALTEDGRFRMEDPGHPLVEGTYSVGGQDTSVSTGLAGPAIRFSAVPDIFMDSVFVLSLSGDTLKLLTRASDDYDYTFVRGSGR